MAKRIKIGKTAIGRLKFDKSTENSITYRGVDFGWRTRKQTYMVGFSLLTKPRS